MGSPITAAKHGLIISPSSVTGDKAAYLPLGLAKGSKISVKYY